MAPQAVQCVGRYNNVTNTHNSQTRTAQSYINVPVSETACNNSYHYSIYFIQDTQIVLNAMVRIVPFSVPVLPPGSGSGAQSQLQLEFGLPLTEVSVAPGGH